MEPETLRQLRGAADLVTDAVDAATGAIGEAHHGIVRLVYAPFRLLGPLALPVRVIEQLQQGITSGVYQSILAVNQLVRFTATVALEQMQHAESSKPKPDKPSASNG